MAGRLVGPYSTALFNNAVYSEEERKAVIS